ncbi:MAG: cytochrome d ubiquinol oxidase subunit II [Myxococcales bacterium]|jgi:cytochrome d ubiquinol oxidase subunit II
MDLNAIWFAVLGLLLAGYAVLDGFDLGVGILHPMTRRDSERRAFINVIGPIWDGNEVWLVVFGGALFAAFPMAYATVFSAFYLPFMALLFALILRAASIEFRGKMPSERLRRACDWGFFASSLLASLLFGVGVGNTVIGLPLDERGVFAGRLVDLLSPYALGVGALTAAMFAMHGAVYLHLRLHEGPLQARVRRALWFAWGAFLVAYAVMTTVTLLFVPTATANFARHPWAWGVVALNVLAVLNVPRAVRANRPLQAFASSALTILALVGLLGLALWPNLVGASNAPELSLDIYRAASSPKTLRVMLVFVAIGMPFVLVYTGIVYWTFRARVKEEEHEGY